MIIRGLAGLILGLGYGLLAGALTYLVYFVTVDSPGPMIPDNYGWAKLVAVYATVICGVCGALVGLVVGLSGVGKARAAMIGSALGLVVSLPFLFSSWNAGARLSGPLWKEFFSALLFLFLLFPVGLTLTGIVVSVVGRKLKP